MSESTRADIEAGSEMYFVRGNVLVQLGFLAVYPLQLAPKDEEIPKVEEGQELAFAAEPGAERAKKKKKKADPAVHRASGRAS